MAIIELYAFKETPSRVVINEYINVAHSFFPVMSQKWRMVF
ncbi:transcription antitermination NusB family protein [Entomobacter blattae]|nr:hypothetical protein [Entomobacter blattae]